MTKWFYYNENGEKIEVTGGQLKGLAKAGRITPNTVVETAEGKTAPARKVNGLVFAALPVQQPAVTPIQPTVQSQPIAPAPLAAAATSATVVAKTFCCNSCGTPLKIPKNSKGHVQCPSCRNDCVLDGLVKNAEIAAKENINSGIPLTATPAMLHRQLVSQFYKSPDIPLDIFEKAEIVREEHHCVPAYCFRCTEKSVAYTVFASGSNQFDQVIALIPIDSSQLVDIEEFTFRPTWKRMATTYPKLRHSTDMLPSTGTFLEEKKTIWTCAKITFTISLAFAILLPTEVRHGRYHFTEISSTSE